MDRRDYEEPACPMDNSMWVKKEVFPIPAGRVIAKEDQYLAKNDYASAERHLLYWWKEAERGHDERGKLLLCNELMGLHRKLGNREKAMKYAQEALAITEQLGLQDTVSGATAFLNAGTVYKAFGDPERSLEYFEKARAVYEQELEPDNGRKAGLYNNMALTLVDLKRFAEAEELYRSAIAITENTDKAGEAVTWLNLADCVVAEKGMEAAESCIQEYLDTAEKLLDAVPESERDGNYAYACEKCAPVFDFYGYFIAARKFKRLAEAIYAGQ